MKVTDPETLTFLREFERFTALDRGGTIQAPEGVTMRPADLPGPDDNPQALIERGWVYREFGWRSERLWERLLAKLGEGEYKLLAMSERMRPSGLYVRERRGQMLISPKARETSGL